MVAGGTGRRLICRIGLAGFAAARALSTSYNETPTKASRPWDKGRDGFVMGEGAGIVVLEEYEHAKKRGAQIYAEIVGYGLSGDAFHITAPAPEHEGAFRAMSAALYETRQHEPGPDLDYINGRMVHVDAAGRRAGALKAVKNLFGESAYKLSMSSTKSAIGHLFGAAGAVEAIFSVLAIRDQIAPPTLNLDDPSEGCDLDLVACIKAKPA